MVLPLNMKLTVPATLVVAVMFFATRYSGVPISIVIVVVVGPVPTLTVTVAEVELA
jgi:hypothetical protein